MVTQNRYLLAALPGLGELGSTAPLTPADMLEQVTASPGCRVLLDALFLSDDLLQRQAFLAGELKELELAILTAQQGRNEQPLPDYLIISEEEQDSRQQVMLDHIWQGYYDHAAAVAKQQNSVFLAAWVGYEVAQRNAVAAARAKALHLDAAEYLVRPELADSQEDFSGLLAEWTAARNPLAGLRVLDTARWVWLADRDGWFTFKDDELAAYGAKLMLLRRWQRLTSESASQVTNN